MENFVGVYSDARSEYTKQLCLFLVPVYFRYFIRLLEKAKETTAQEPKKILWQFQTYLNDIPEWNMEKLNNEILNLQNEIGCDYLEDLLTAVFIAHTKVLTAIRLHSRQKKIQITVPKQEHFLFKVLCETSKLIWGSSYLFSENVTNIEKQKNYRQIEILISDGIHQAIRALVPVKSILKDFVNLNENVGDDDEENTIEHKTAENIHHKDNEKIFDDREELEESNSLKDNNDNNIIDNNDNKLNESKDSKESDEMINEEKINEEKEKDKEQDNNENVVTDKNYVDSTPNIVQPVIKNQMNSEPRNDISANPVINISETPKEVAFSQYVTVFSPTNPNKSDIIKENSENNSDDSGSLSLEFLDDSQNDLTTNDFEEIDKKISDNEMSLNDYEILA